MEKFCVHFQDFKLNTHSVAKQIDIPVIFSYHVTSHCYLLCDWCVLIRFICHSLYMR